MSTGSESGGLRTLSRSQYSDEVKRYAHEVIDTQIIPRVFDKSGAPRRPPLRTHPVSEKQLLQMSHDEEMLSSASPKDSSAYTGLGMTQSMLEMERKPIGLFDEVRRSQTRIVESELKRKYSGDVETPDTIMRGVSPVLGAMVSKKTAIAKSGAAPETVDASISAEELNMALSRHLRLEVPKTDADITAVAQLPVNVAAGVLETVGLMGVAEAGATPAVSHAIVAKDTPAVTSTGAIVSAVASAAMMPSMPETSPIAAIPMSKSAAVVSAERMPMAISPGLSMAAAATTSSRSGAAAPSSSTSSRRDKSSRRKYEVLVQARVRLGEDMTSPHITDLPEGTSVTVAEIKGRRARIVRPIHGWLSTNSKMGGRILIPLDTHFSKVGRGVLITDPSTRLSYQGKIIDYDEKRKKHKTRLTTGKEMFIDLSDPLVKIEPDSYQRAMKNKLSSDAPIYDPKAPAHTIAGGRMALFHKIFASDYPSFVEKARRKVLEAHAANGYSSKGSLAAARAALYAHSRGHGRSHGASSKERIAATGDGSKAAAAMTAISGMSRTDLDRIRKWKDYFDKFSLEKYPDHLKLYVADLKNRQIKVTQEVEDRYKMYYEKKLREKEKFMAKQKHTLVAMKKSGFLSHSSRLGEAVTAASTTAAAGTGSTTTLTAMSSTSKTQGSAKSPRGLIVLRGLPGSGKTSLGRKLAARSSDARICTEDKYHWSGGEDGAGEYQFKPELVFLAREWCTKEIRSHIKKGTPLIILDNHNARISMYEDHIQYAVKYGYRFRIIEFLGTEEHIDRYRERSYKKFPREVYVKLLKLWERDPRAEVVNPVFASDKKAAAKKTDV